MACDINIGFGKVRHGIHRGGPRREQTKRNARHSDGGKEKREETNQRTTGEKLVSRPRWVIAYCAVAMFGPPSFSLSLPLILSLFLGQLPCFFLLLGRLKSAHLSPKFKPNSWKHQCASLRDYETSKCVTVYSTQTISVAQSLLFFCVCNHKGIPMVNALNSNKAAKLLSYLAKQQVHNLIFTDLSAKYSKYSKFVLK